MPTRKRRWRSGTRWVVVSSHQSPMKGKNRRSNLTMGRNEHRTLLHVHTPGLSELPVDRSGRLVLLECAIHYKRSRLSAAMGEGGDDDPNVPGALLQNYNYIYNHFVWIRKLGLDLELHIPTLIPTLPRRPSRSSSTRTSRGTMWGTRRM